LGSLEAKHLVCKPFNPERMAAGTEKMGARLRLATLFAPQGSLVLICDLRNKRKAKHSIEYCLYLGFLARNQIPLWLQDFEIKKLLH
jgi:hypothetical protein